MDEDLIDRLQAFVAELRTIGLPVSLSEGIDAVQAVERGGVADRDAFREGLASTLVKTAEHRSAFDAVFEIFFASAPAAPTGGAEGVTEDVAAASGLGDEPGTVLGAMDLASAARQVLIEGDGLLMRVLAEAAVAQHAGMQPGRRAGVSLYALRALRPLNLDQAVRQVGDDLVHNTGKRMAFEARILRDRVEDNRRRLIQAVEAEVRRRLVEDRGAQAVAKTLRVSLPQDIDFTRANVNELEAMGRAVEPLTRTLARRLARNRLRRSGRVDLRGTIRRSMATGGVPVDLRTSPPRPPKPELVLVADVSGSVASFADFTLQLVYSMSGYFSRIRTFVFVDGVSEITEHVREAQGLPDLLEKVSSQSEAIWLDGRSDYGNALAQFWQRWGGELSRRTSVIVLGDARNNFRADQSHVLRSIAGRAGHLYWLNPEPVRYWNSGDSLADVYGRHCDAMVECRNLRQLEQFVESVL